MPITLIPSKASTAPLLECEMILTKFDLAGIGRDDKSNTFSAPKITGDLKIVFNLTRMECVAGAATAR
jgi:hypothetical protein